MEKYQKIGRGAILSVFLKEKVMLCYRGNYRALKRLKHNMKVLEWVAEIKIRSIIKIDLDSCKDVVLLTLYPPEDKCRKNFMQRTEICILFLLI